MSLLNRALRLSTAVGRRSIMVGRDGGKWNTVLLMVPQAKVWMIDRFGKFSRAAEPGLNFAIPFVEKIAYRRTLKETPFPVSPQTAITEDNVHVSLDGAVYAAVFDPYLDSYGVENPKRAVSVLAKSAMRKEVGNLELDQLYLAREQLNVSIALALDEASAKWGIHVRRYEIANITVDAHTRLAMERQSNAERVRCAEVLESEGHRQKLINESKGKMHWAINDAQGEAEAVRLKALAEAEAKAVNAERLREADVRTSEGARQILINQSEGQKQDAINKATGQAEGIRLRAQADAETVALLAKSEAERTRLHASATADGLRVVAGALGAEGGQEAMHQRLAEVYVRELPAMAKHSKMIIVPDRPNDVAAVLATALSVGAHAPAKAERP
jgi:regulator of protease activity HflC (stomatin/prohibitin superfamily)